MVNKSNHNNKQIAKNTLFLYFRMLSGLLVSLYTAKIILDVLGAEDYGLNNLIGGVLTLFAFINSSLYAATSRYLTYELGCGNIPILRKTFSNAMALHIILAIVVVCLGETIGIYLVNDILAIPNNRMYACNILFQATIISTFFTLAQVPYGALIISYEKMNIYAYIGIYDIFARCGVVFLLQYSPYDKLITLAVLNLIISILLSLFQMLYCRYSFKEVFSFNIKIDKKIARSMLKFSTWNLLGSAAFTLRIQGVNILLNLFFGPVVNAANAIAYRVNSAVVGFISNFTTAVNPQITKTYAAEEYAAMKTLIFRAGKFTFFMLLMLCYPLLFETNYILHLWLGNNIPEYTVIMTQLVLIIAMVETFTYSIGCAINATGNIKYYQLVICSIMLMIFPITFILFKLDFPPYSALVVYLITSTIALASRMYFIKAYLYISPKEYVSQVFIPAGIVACICLIIPTIIVYFMNDGVLRCTVVIAAIELSAIFFILAIGMNTNERQFVMRFIKNKLKR